MERLGGRRLSPFGTEASPERWTILLDAGGEPVAVSPPGGAEPVTHFLVADAEMTVESVLASPAFRDLDPDVPVVVMREGAVAGLWEENDLADAIMHGPARLPVDLRLPGAIRIPEIRRRCRMCQSVMSFAEKPEEMPMCVNESELPAHDFAW